MLWEHVPGQAPTLIDLEDLFGVPSVVSVALGLNNVFPSAVVGFHSYVGPSEPTPVWWDKNAGPIELSTLSQSGFGEAYGVNDAGTIAGWSTDVSGNRLACTWTAQNLQIQSLGTLGGPTSDARAINGTGHLAGVADVAAGVGHAFHWTQAAGMQDLHLGASGTSIALGMNNSDEVVGELDPGTGGTLQLEAFAGLPRPAHTYCPGCPAPTMDSRPPSMTSE
jgi:probable HAF family extracellular repeat protein